MAVWSSQNIMLTTKGAAAISKVQSGIGKLTITKVVASEQYVPESTLRGCHFSFSGKPSSHYH